MSYEIEQVAADLSKSLLIQNQYHIAAPHKSGMDAEKAANEMALIFKIIHAQVLQCYENRQSGQSGRRQP